MANKKINTEQKKGTEKKLSKKETAKTIKSTKKIMLNHTFVESAFNASAPKTALTKEPNST